MPRGGGSTLVVAAGRDGALAVDAADLGDDDPDPETFLRPVADVDLAARERAVRVDAARGGRVVAAIANGYVRRYAVVDVS